MLNIEEIKAREQAATPGQWYGTFPDEKGNIRISVEGNAITKVAFVPQKSDAEFIIWSHNDFVPKLLAEVERLTAENEQNASYVDICEGICDRYEENFKALLDNAKALQSENATLKKALELACRNACDEVDRKTMADWDMIGCVPDETCMKENPCKGSDNQCHECWTKYFMNQAQQLTHETHGESEVNHD